MNDENETNPLLRYKWPRFVLAAVVLGLALAIFWMTMLVRRTREQRESNPWRPDAAQSPLQTNPPVKTKVP